MDEIILQRIADQITELHLRIRAIRVLFSTSVSATLLEDLLDKPIDHHDQNFLELRGLVLQYLQAQSEHGDSQVH